MKGEIAMRKTIFAALILSAAVILTACGKEQGGKTDGISSESLYVKKVENLSDDFWIGMDASSVPAEEASGVKYLNFEGEEQDVFKTLADSGINCIRVRVWNHPYDKDGNGYGGGNCDINTAIEIGRRATEYGMKLIVDFHLSDFWADPSKQMVPLGWADLDIETKTEAVYEYVSGCLKLLNDNGIDVGMVQIGNETNGVLCGEKIWFNIQYLMQAGAKAVREVFPEALVALHFANPEKVTNYEDYAKKLEYYQVDYDVFASSYYPYWHGTLDNLAAVLSQIAEKYDKKVMVMETAYAYTADDTDFYGNTISDGSAVTKAYPYTVQGQANCIRDTVDTIRNKTVNGIGVVYWEGTWISVGGESREKNSQLWEKFGSGWATSYAGAYDPDDAGRYYGGCSVDNQALFDSKGKPLESLKVFALMRYGNEIEPLVDAVEDCFVECDINGELKLPDTVNAVMTDDSKQPVDVVWNINDELLQNIYSGGPAKYSITGNADGRPAVCQISMMEFNYIDNYGFETGEPEPWIIREYGNADELYVEDKISDSLTGSHHMHFWSAAKDSIEFELEQTVENLRAGQYKYTISIMGGDAGETDIYSYVKIDGEIISTSPLVITSYNDWHSAVIEGIEFTDGQTLAVGIYVRCSGEGNGAWGKIDDAMLNSVS